MKNLIGCLVIVVVLGWGMPAVAAKGECPSGKAGLVCLAENGDTNAQFAFGMALLEGDGVPEDRMEALKWLDRAAKGGHTSANQMLAAMSLSTQPGEFCAGKN